MPPRRIWHLAPFETSRIQVPCMGHILGTPSCRVPHVLTNALCDVGDSRHFPASLPCASSKDDAMLHQGVQRHPPRH
eukprot:scaffold246415_cov27-Tisochrysis_lutea.AAC.2